MKVMLLLGSGFCPIQAPQPGPKVLHLRTSRPPMTVRLQKRLPAPPSCRAQSLPPSDPHSGASKPRPPPLTPRWDWRFLLRRLRRRSRQDVKPRLPPPRLLSPPNPAPWSDGITSRGPARLALRLLLARSYLHGGRRRLDGPLSCLTERRPGNLRAGAEAW